MNDSYRTCSTCKEKKILDDFPWRNKSKNIKHRYCKLCHAKCNRRRYAKHAEKHKETVARWDYNYRLTVYRYIFHYFKDNPCIDCGQTNPIFLQFDHINNKKFNISHGIASNYPLGVIIEEIKKCEIRCIKCHRLKTFKDIGWGGFEFIDENGDYLN